MRLIIFDADGTLVDSQDDICAAMAVAYSASGRECPSRDDIRSIVGLSLAEAIARLSPDAEPAEQRLLVDGYKGAFVQLRQRKDATQFAPLYPGTKEMLDALAGQSGTLLALATGKSRRGVAKLIEAHDLGGMFVTQQTADTHPSKPHPSMIAACLADTGVSVSRAVMVGDTTFDMDMGTAAGVATIGVSWGYHPASELRTRGAHMIDTWSELASTLDRIGLTEFAG